MDDKTRRELRQSARILHWVTQLLLVAAFFYVLFGNVLTGAAAIYFKIQRLGQAHMAVVTASILDRYEKLRDLERQPPPTDAKLRVAWADSVAAHFGYPVAVFTKIGNEIQPLLAPPHLQYALDELPARFAGNVSKREALDTDTTAAGLVLWNGGLHRDKFAARVRAFEPLGGGTGWGIIAGESDEAAEFIRNIFDLARFKRLGYAARLASYDIRQWGTPEESLFKAGLRAFRGDTLLAATPALDTTREFDVREFNGLRLEHYLPARDQEEFEALANRTPWLLYFFPALMIIVYFFHRWIKRLTAE